MTDDQLDAFLQDATLAVNEHWSKATGRDLTTDELCEINDLLTAYFANKRDAET